MDAFLHAGSKAALATAASYAALLVVLGIVLAARVIGVRRAKLVGIGDGGDKELARRIRAHGNFSEYVPLILGLIILLPFLGASAGQIHLVGLLALIGRIAHAVGISRSVGASLPRVGGMVSTFISLGIGVVLVLFLAWR